MLYFNNFKSMKTKTIFIFFYILSTNTIISQATFDKIPKVYANIFRDSIGKLYVLKDGIKIYEKPVVPTLLLKQAVAKIICTESGIQLDFEKENLEGTLNAGFIPYGDSKHPIPVYIRNEYEVKNGKTTIAIKTDFAGNRDFVKWEDGKTFTLGYRLLNKKGLMLYDGKVSLAYQKGLFIKQPTIIEGPIVNKVTPTSVTISYTTDETVATLSKLFLTQNIVSFEKKDKLETKNHEITFENLKPNSTYKYTIEGAGNIPFFDFKTTPLPGSRKKFTFSYASDSRNGGGGGERNLYGANFYIMKKMMALNKLKNVAFSQFTGDLQGGYLTEPDEANLMFANWKRAVEPYAAYFPVYVTMGNHETLTYNFNDGKNKFSVDKFPFETQSAEKLFADNFVMPLNGPSSEDGASYDPDVTQIDFPTYKENVFYYVYDNVAMIVLNTNYFFAPTNKEVPYVGGGLHGYIMDIQLKWLENTLKKLEEDTDIDHIFVTNHTPFFPNGGHVADDMWYSGNNTKRSSIAGKPLEKGIIERRDELLDLLINKSKKVVATFAGDEHNYCKTIIGPDTIIYPENWDKPKLKLTRNITQIINGSAGAPYYAQEKTPWTQQTTGFTTQNALVFIHVNGKKVIVEVQNPDTLENIENYTLK